MTKDNAQAVLDERARCLGIVEYLWLPPQPLWIASLLLGIAVAFHYEANGAAWFQLGLLIGAFLRYLLCHVAIRSGVLEAVRAGHTGTMDSEASASRWQELNKALESIMNDPEMKPSREALDSMLPPGMTRDQAVRKAIEAERFFLGTRDRDEDNGGGS